MLRAYFDESERQSGLLCVGGYIFAEEQAKKLTKQFRTAFGQYGGFHMADLLGKRRRFKGITDRQRDVLIIEAVQIVRSRFSYGVAVTVNRQEYESQAPRWIRGFRDAYPFLCHLAVHAAAIIARKHNDADRIEYVFEAGHAHIGEARHILTRMSQSPELCEECLYGGHSFALKADTVALQAADLLAWECAKFKDETVDAKIRDIRLSLKSLFSANPKRYQVVFCGGSSLTRALDKYRALGLEQIAEDKVTGSADTSPTRKAKGQGHNL